VDACIAKQKNCRHLLTEYSKLHSYTQVLQSLRSASVNTQTQTLISLWVMHQQCSYSKWARRSLRSLVRPTIRATDNFHYAQRMFSISYTTEERNFTKWYRYVHVLTLLLQITYYIVVVYIWNISKNIYNPASLIGLHGNALTCETRYFWLLMYRLLLHCFSSNT